MRIVSLIPEATEILGALGLADQLVRTGKPHPPSPAPRDGTGEGGWGLSLSADLIFTSETEAGGGMPRAEVRRAIAGLRPRPGVYALEPHSLGEILSDIKTVGDATGRQAPARALLEALRARIDAVSLRSARAVARRGVRRVVCLTQNDPPIAAGWWQAELVGLAGGLDVLDGVGRPPRAVTWDEVRARQPDLTIDLAQLGLSATPGPWAVHLLERFVALILPRERGDDRDTRL